jgi:hypothetical protein
MEADRELKAITTSILSRILSDELHIVKIINGKNGGRIARDYPAKKRKL